MLGLANGCHDGCFRCQPPNVQRDEYSFVIGVQRDDRACTTGDGGALENIVTTGIANDAGAAEHGCVLYLAGAGADDDNLVRVTPIVE